MCNTFVAYLFDINLLMTHNFSTSDEIVPPIGVIQAPCGS